jgi:hypothetical protein
VVVVAALLLVAAAVKLAVLLQTAVEMVVTQVMV